MFSSLLNFQFCLLSFSFQDKSPTKRHAPITFTGEKNGKGGDTKGAKHPRQGTDGQKVYSPPSGKYSNKVQNYTNRSGGGGSGNGGGFNNRSSGGGNNRSSSGGNRNRNGGGGGGGRGGNRNRNNNFRRNY